MEESNDVPKSNKNNSIVLQRSNSGECVAITTANGQTYHADTPEFVVQVAQVRQCLDESATRATIRAFRQSIGKQLNQLDETCDDIDQLLFDKKNPRSSDRLESKQGFNETNNKLRSSEYGGIRDQRPNMCSKRRERANSLSDYTSRGNETKLSPTERTSKQVSLLNSRHRRNWCEHGNIDPKHRKNESKSIKTKVKFQRPLDRIERTLESRVIEHRTIEHIELKPGDQVFRTVEFDERMNGHKDDPIGNDENQMERLLLSVVPDINTRDSLEDLYADTLISSDECDKDKLKNIEEESGQEIENTQGYFRTKNGIQVLKKQLLKMPVLKSLSGGKLDTQVDEAMNTLGQLRATSTLLEMKQRQLAAYKEKLLQEKEKCIEKGKDNEQVEEGEKETHDGVNVYNQKVPTIGKVGFRGTTIFDVIGKNQEHTYLNSPIDEVSVHISPKSQTSHSQELSSGDLQNQHMYVKDVSAVEKVMGIAIDQLALAKVKDAYITGDNLENLYHSFHDLRSNYDVESLNTVNAKLDEEEAHVHKYHQFSNTQTLIPLDYERVVTLKLQMKENTWKDLNKKQMMAMVNDHLKKCQLNEDDHVLIEVICTADKKDSKSPYVKTDFRISVVRPDMFKRAMIENEDLVCESVPELSHTNIYPANIRMFLRLPVLRGSVIDLKDEKQNR